MAEEKVFPKGLMIFPKKENQPEFVIGSMVVDVDNIANDNSQYLTDYQGKRQLRVQILKSREGKVYMQVDTWKPNTASDTRSAEQLKKINDAEHVNISEPADFQDLPF